MKFEDAFITGTINANENIADRKTKIKKLVKETIEENTLLKEFLEKNHIKGEFIKEATNRALHNSIKGYNNSSIIAGVSDQYRPICSSIYWRDTSKGIDYWNDIDEKFVRFRDKHQ